MKIIIGSDHRGFKAKEFLKKHITGYEIIDVGAFSNDPVDYPNVSKDLVCKMEEDFNNSLGIILCGSGLGVCIAVNRYPKIRGALIYNTSTAKSAKQHSNANVLCLSADNFTGEELLDFIKIFFAEKFAGGRHQKRILELEQQ